MLDADAGVVLRASGPAAQALTAIAATATNGATTSLPSTVATATPAVPPGSTSTSHNAAAENGWRSVTFGNGSFVAVSSDGTSTRVMTSP